MSNRTVQGAVSIPIAASQTAIATTNNTFELPNDLSCAAFIFDVTAGSGTTPTLDFNIQTSPDNGTTYYTMFRTAQITGAAIHRLVACFYGGTGNSGTTGTNANSGNAIVIATTGGALSAGCPVFFKKMRISAVIGGTNPSFTYVIHCIGMPVYTGFGGVGV